MMCKIQCTNTKYICRKGFLSTTNDIALVLIKRTKNELHKHVLRSLRYKMSTW